MPYVADRMIDLPLMQSCNLLRQKVGDRVEDRGYELSIPYYSPSLMPTADRCQRCASQLPDQLHTKTEMYKIAQLIILFPNTDGTIPEDFSRKVAGTESFTWRLWDWHITYYLTHPAKLVFHIHLPPPHVIKEYVMKIYLLTMLAYLKSMFPHACLLYTSPSPRDRG